MVVTVKLFAGFREGRFIKEDQSLAAATKVVDIVDNLGIDREEIGVLMCNSRQIPLDRILEDGDVPAIFPVVGGG